MVHLCTYLQRRHGREGTCAETRPMSRLRHNLHQPPTQSPQLLPVQHASRQRAVYKRGTLRHLAQLIPQPL